MESTFYNFSKFGLEASTADPCIFTDKTKDLILVIYVDDGLIASKNQSKMAKILKVLKSEFELTMEPINKYLGIEIEEKEDRSIFICQKGYAQEVLERFSMISSNPVSILIEVSEDLTSDTNEAEHHCPYREAIGSLMHLANITRPNLCYAVNKLSQYMKKPKWKHWTAVKKILKYLKGTIKLGIFYTANNDLDLRGYSDSNFSGDSTSRKSTTGYVFFECRRCHIMGIQKTANCSPIYYGS